MDVMHIRIHMSIRRIKDKAFLCRTQLRIVILNKELEEIGMRAFADCQSLESIVIPNAIKRIEEGTFNGCWRLTSATLRDGLEEIGASPGRQSRRRFGAVHSRRPSTSPSCGRICRTTTTTR